MTRLTYLSTATIPGTDVELALGIKAGPWTFLTGREATLYDGGIAAEAAPAAGLPLHGKPSHRLQAEYVFARFGELLKAAGTDPRHAVRLDQYYPTAKAVDPYHHARRAFFGNYIPPSTSVLMDRLLIDDAALNVSMIALDPSISVDPVQPKNVEAPKWSGFAPAINAGDFVFVAGQMANSPEWGLDPKAHVPDFAAWGGTEIIKQSEFVIRDRLEPALQAAGSSLADVVKAQAYLAHASDIPEFMSLWHDIFGDTPCALTVATTSGYGITEGIVEVNALALKSGAATTKTLVRPELPAAMSYGQPAVKAGDLLCLPGLMAAGADGVDPRVAATAGMSRTGARAAAEAQVLVDAIEAYCAAAGASAENIVRMNLFFEDLADFPAVASTLSRRLGGRPLPLGAVEMPSPFALPGAGLIADVWVYAP